MSATDALTLLLTAESLLLAAVALAVAVAVPSRGVQRFLISPAWLAMAAVLALAVAGLGAGFAWGELYWGSFPKDWPNRVVSGSLLFTIVLEPLIAFFLAMGMWTEK